MTIADGAKFVQTEGIAWTQLGSAKVIITGGATYDLGTSGQLNLGNGRIEIRDGGSLLLPNATFVAENGQIVIDKGALTCEGTFTAGSGEITVDGGSLTCAGNFTAGSGEISINNDGALNCAGTFVAGSGEITIDGGAMEANVFALGAGKLTFKQDASLVCKTEFSREDSAVVTFEEGATPNLSLNGNLKLLATDDFSAGDITITGELQPVTGATFAGANWTAKILAPQANGTIIAAKAGHITVLNSANDGFWAPGGSYIDIVEGSTTSFTFPLSKATVYDKLIKTQKFRYQGNAIPQAEFEDARLWTVVEEGEGDSVKTTFSLPESLAILPSWGSVRTSTLAVESMVRLYGTLEQVGTLEIKEARVRYCLAGASEDTFEKLTVPVGIADGYEFYALLQGLEAKKEYVYQFQLITTDDEVFSSAEDTFVTYFVPAGVNAWIGQTNSLASEPSNWSTGTVPDTECDVKVVDVLAKSMNLVWDLPSATLRGWTQESLTGGVDTVSFQTTPTAPVTFTGDVILGTGANWTHAGPPSAGEEPQYALNLVFEKDLTVAEGAYIQAGRGVTNDERFKGRGWYNGGPGYFNIGGENIENRQALGRGASFAGEGGYRTATFPEGLDFVTYGSALKPTGWGSSGHGDGPSFAGGGWIRLVVKGTLTLDGMIASVGFGYPNVTAGTSVALPRAVSSILKRRSWKVRARFPPMEVAIVKVVMVRATAFALSSQRSRPR